MEKKKEKNQEELGHFSGFPSVWLETPKKSF